MSIEREDYDEWQNERDTWGEEQTILRQALAVVRGIAAGHRAKVNATVEAATIKRQLDTTDDLELAASYNAHYLDALATLHQAEASLSMAMRQCVQITREADAMQVSDADGPMPRDEVPF